MANPESPYPYNPDAWEEIDGFTVATLAEHEVYSDIGSGANPWIDTTWRALGTSFACRLERPLVIPDPSTVHTLAFENDQYGMRKHISNRTPFITAGERRPSKYRPCDYGILKYCKAQGLISEPEGVLPERYVQTNLNVEDPKDPAQRIVVFENIIKDLLGQVARGHRRSL